MKKNQESGAIRKNLRSQGPIAQNDQERLINSISPMLFSHPPPNVSQQYSNVTNQSADQNFDTDTLVEQRPRVLRTPVGMMSSHRGDISEESVNDQRQLSIGRDQVSDSLAQNLMNVSNESNSLAGPSYSSLSHIGAAGGETDAISKIRDEPIFESEDNRNSQRHNNEVPNPSDQVPDSMKAYINLTLVNAFASYAESMKSEISDSIKKIMKDNFIEFLGDMNTATLPLRREEPNPKASSKTKSVDKPNCTNNSQTQIAQSFAPQQPAVANSQVSANNRNRNNLNDLNQHDYRSQLQRPQPQLNYHPPPQDSRNQTGRQSQQDQQFVQVYGRANQQPTFNQAPQQYQPSFPSAFSHTSNIFKPINQPPNNEVRYNVTYSRNQTDFNNFNGQHQNILNPNRDSNSNPLRNHHEPVKLDRWGLKFDGRPENLSVEDFLHRLEYLQNQYQCSWAEILRQFHLVLSGDAERWYWEFVRYNTRPDWPMLRQAIMLHFRNCKSDYEIMREISDRKQGPSESCDSFFSAIAMIRSQLTTPMPEFELVRMLKRNLNDRIGKLVYPMSIFSLDQLRFACKEAENAFPAREQHASRYYRPPPKMHVHEMHGVEDDDTVDDYVAAMQYAEKHRPRPPNRVLSCWNCKASGHTYWECPSPRLNVFCFKCGEADVVVATCPKCRQKNLQKSTISTGESCSKNNPESSKPE